ncbi:MAG: sugar phosphate isomerase/epimerase [Acidobacteriaceae bacterium]|nr:sugar phosphate isomerase/epimerase [Acidobacteriaceae bacterium]MBV9779385.1 sugar phosphate isomerase/epimerase [Acidobacteriaceae bacterium]
MKKAIGDTIFPAGTSFEDGLKLLKRAGYDGVELWLGERPWFQMKTSDIDVGRLFAKVQDAGLEVSHVANSLDWDENISARDPAKREAAFRHIERQIEAAQMLHTDAVLIVAGVVTGETPYNEVYNRCVETLRKLGEIAGRARVKIGVENCNSEQRFLLSPREFRNFLNDVNSPWVGIHLDVGNIHDTGFAEQWIEIHGPRITRIHVKDVMKHRGRCGQESVYTNIFLGDNNWRAIRDAMTKVRYDGWLIAEMEARYRYASDQQIFDTSAALGRLISGQL